MNIIPGIPAPVYSPIKSSQTSIHRSVLMHGRENTIWYVVCQNAYKLAQLANQYAILGALYGKPTVNLATSISSNDSTLIFKLPREVVNQISEWVRFFRETEIPAEYKVKSIFSPTIEYRIICPDVLRDNPYKAFIPFTNMFSLSKHERDIHKMMQDITEIVYGIGIYVSVLLPITKYDQPNEEDRIANEILS
jgi:hypothetical protein